jgi:class 3 adenylate cyclase
MNREVIEAYLQNQQYRVTVAPNAKRALTLAHEDPPDLIMLDIMLPDMTGYEVCARFKADPKTQFVPVVVVTALEADEDRLRAIQAGADDFITKPFNSLLMLTRVKSLLNLKRLHDEVQARTDLLQRILNRYVDKDIAAIIMIDPDRYLQLGGETRRITVVFADISGFTAFGERHSAQEVVGVLNRFFSELTPLIFEHKGTFDKYIGDEIMAFFGAPVATGDDTLNAVSLALALKRQFEIVRQALGELGESLYLSIGVHTGDAVVGNVGSPQRMNYTVIGDVVNTAHRLQEVAEKSQILISQTTYQEIELLVEVGTAVPKVVSGKRDPLITYELKGLKS